MVSSIDSSTNDTPKNFRLFIGFASKGAKKWRADTDLYATFSLFTTYFKENFQASSEKSVTVTYLHLISVTYLYLISFFRGVIFFVLEYFTL